MKFSNFAMIALMATSVLFTSCDSEDTVEPVVQENNVPDGTTTYTLSVHVLSSSETAAKVSGLESAEVTVNQHGDESTITVGPDGIATFSNLDEGQVSVYIKAEGHASVNFPVDIDELTNSQINNDFGNDSQHEFFGRVQQVMPRLNGSISGKFFYNDEDGDDVTGATSITLEYDESIEPNVFTLTTDASGDFTLTGLPEGVRGELTGKISVTEERQNFDVLVDYRSDAMSITTNGSEVDNLSVIEMDRED